MEEARGGEGLTGDQHLIWVGSVCIGGRDGIQSDLQRSGNMGPPVVS